MQRAEDNVRMLAAPRCNWDTTREVFIETFNEIMNRLHVRKVVVVDIDAEAEELWQGAWISRRLQSTTTAMCSHQASVLAVDNLVLSELNNVGERLASDCHKCLEEVEERPTQECTDAWMSGMSSVCSTTRQRGRT